VDFFFVRLLEIYFNHHCTNSLRIYWWKRKGNRSGLQQLYFKTN